MTNAVSSLDVTSYNKDLPVVTARGVADQVEPLFQGRDNSDVQTYKVMQDGSAYLAKFLDIKENTAPSTPASGIGRFYVKSSDSKPHFISDGGTDYDLTDTVDTEAIHATIADAKGDLIAGTAADTVARLAVGANKKLLVANSAQTTGLEWTDAIEPATVKIGGGAILAKIIRHTESRDWSTVAAYNVFGGVNFYSDEIFTVTGAAIGDTVIATPDNTLEAGLIWSAFVDHSNSVTIRLTNVSSADIDPGTNTWSIVILHFS